MIIFYLLIRLFLPFLRNGHFAVIETGYFANDMHNDMLLLVVVRANQQSTF